MLKIILQTSYNFYLIIIALVCLNLSACSQNELENNRIVTMKKILKAFSKNDSTELYSLVDTAYYYSIKSKESFLHNQNSLYSCFTLNNIDINNSDFKLDNNINKSRTSYKIVFPLNKGTCDSVAITFIFNYGVSEMVNIFYVKYHSIKNDTPILMAPGG